MPQIFDVIANENARYKRKWIRIWGPFHIMDDICLRYHIKMVELELHVIYNINSWCPESIPEDRQGYVSWKQHYQQRPLQIHDCTVLVKHNEQNKNFIRTYVLVDMTKMLKHSLKRREIFT